LLSILLDYQDDLLEMQVELRPNEGLIIALKV